MINNATEKLPQPRYLWFFMLSFAMVISISNWYDARLVAIFGFVISPGALSYPLSFLISDSITEVYGYKNARLAIWATLFFNLLFLLFGQLVIHLPSPAFANDNEMFNKLLSMNLWIVAGSFISYLTAEPLNSYLIAKLKILMKGRYIGIRFIISTIIAAFLDTVIFIFIAFHQSLNLSNMVMLAINVWLIKVFIESTFLPFSIRITKWLKQREEVDIYDYKTNFNVFNLNSSYQYQDNYFKRDKY